MTVGTRPGRKTGDTSSAALFRDKSPGKEAVLSFTTTTRHGDARAPGALEKILKSKSLPTAFACAEQVHGSLVEVVPSLPKSKKYLRADGLLTEAAGQPLAIFTADCTPIFLSDREQRVVGVLHAGWRGARAGILGKAVRLIRRKWKIPARQLQVWLGPSIGPCCFEVQWDVARYFPGTRKRVQDRWRVDLAKELQAQSKRLGVHFLRAKSAATCTMHHPRFYSYRRDRTDKRMASVILKKL